MAHPVHPAVVHFPIACWTLSTLGDIVSIWLGRSAWEISGVLLIIGVGTAIAAMITGLLELRKITSTEGLDTAIDAHIQLVLAAWILYTASLIMRFTGLKLHAPGIAEILLSATGSIVLVAAGWQGGKLVYQYGVGFNRAKDC